MDERNFDVVEDFQENPVSPKPEDSDEGQYEGDYPVDPTTGKPWWWGVWQGMPEFVQFKLDAWRTIKVHFRNEEDLLEFGRLLGQNVSLSTKSVWFPKVVEVKQLSEMRFVTEDERPAGSMLARSGGRGRPRGSKNKAVAEKVDPLKELFEGLR